LADDFIANPNPTNVDLKVEFQKIIASEAAKYVCDVFILRIRLIYILRIWLFKKNQQKGEHNKK